MNIIKKTIYSTLIASSLLGLSNKASAQNISRVSPQEVSEWYQNINEPQNERKLENLISDNLETLTHTIDAVKYDCIVEINGKKYVKFTQVGSQYKQFNAEISRDKSTTWTGVYGQLGGDMDDLLETIKLSRNLMFTPAPIYKSNGSLLDIVSNEKKWDIVNHTLVNGEIINGHVLIPRGTINYYMLEPVAKLLISRAGTETGDEFVNLETQKQNKPKDDIRVIRPPKSEINEQYGIGNKFGDAGVILAVTDKGTLGIGAYYETKLSRIGGKVIYYPNMSDDKLKDFTLVKEDIKKLSENYEGHSKETKIGTSNIDMQAIDFAISKGIGKKWSVFGGARIMSLNENYNSTSTLETKIVDLRTGNIIDPDKNVMEPNSASYSQIKANPLVGFGYRVGPLTFSAGWVAPLGEFKDYKHIDENNYATRNIREGKNLKRGPGDFVFSASMRIIGRR